MLFAEKSSRFYEATVTSLALVGVVGSLALTGSHSAERSEPEQSRAVPIVEQPLTHEHPPTDAHTIIDLAGITVPTQLPPAIEAASAAVARIEVKADGEYWAGTGTRLKQGGYLTAGHVALPKRGASCFKVQAKSKINGERQTDHLSYVSGVNEQKNMRDMAIVSEPDVTVVEGPAIELPERNHEKKPGEVVYYTNYQSEAEDARSPHFSVSPIEDDTPKDHSEMAAFAGVVLDYTDEGIMRVLTGIGRDYGKGMPGRKTRGGSSGGPVWSSDATYYGNSTWGWHDVTVADVEQVTKTDVRGIPDDASVTVSYVLPVSQATIAPLLEPAHGQPLPLRCKQ